MCFLSLSLSLSLHLVSSDVACLIYSPLSHATNETQFITLYSPIIYCYKQGKCVLHLAKLMIDARAHTQ